MQPELGAARPPGWIGHNPGYDPAPKREHIRRPEAPPPPPRWLFHGVCGVATLCLLWNASSPAPLLSVGLLAAVSLVIAALVWVVRLGAAVLNRAPVEAWWAVAPLGGLLTVALLVTDAPLHARFSFADGELTQVARSIEASPDPAVAAAALGDLGRVGTCRISHVEVREGGVFFTFYRGEGLFESTGGFAYITPEPTTADDDQVQLAHFRGPWYVWTSVAED